MCLTKQQTINNLIKERDNLHLRMNAYLGQTETYIIMSAIVGTINREIQKLQLELNQ